MIKIKCANCDSDKICSKCGFTREYKNALPHFHKCKTSPDKLQYWCKNCVKNYQQSPQGQKSKRKAVKKYDDTHKAERKIWQEKYKEEKRLYDKDYRNHLWGYLKEVWWNLNQRCNSLKCKAYKNYGGRGIRNLFKGFNEFYHYVTQDLGYDSIVKLRGLQIDRIDNDSHYMVGNIRFVIPKVNNSNRRSNKNN